MRTFKTVATSVALTFLLAGPAAATDTDLNDLFPATVPGKTSTNLFGTLVPGSAFENNYGFDLSGSGATTAATVISLAVKPGLGFSFPFNISLLEWNGLSYQQIASDLNTNNPFISLTLPAGQGGGGFGNSHFVLKVFGQAPSNVLAANYAGVLSVVAVPEPSGWIMLLGGLGVLGVIASRRTKHFGT